eukprot:gene2465-2700_t
MIEPLKRKVENDSIRSLQAIASTIVLLSMEKIVKRASLSIISRSRHFTCSLTTSTTVQVEDNDCLVWTSRRTREWYFSWSPLPPFDSARKIYSRLIVLLELVFPSDEDLSVIEERMCRTCNPCWASLFLRHLHHTGLCLRAGCFFPVFCFGEFGARSVLCCVPFGWPFGRPLLGAHRPMGLWQAKADSTKRLGSGRPGLEPP